MARSKDVFLINLWREGDGLDRPRVTDWRGSVEHVHTRRRFYFTDLVDLVTFLAGYTKPGEVDKGTPGA